MIRTATVRQREAREAKRLREWKSLSRSYTVRRDRTGVAMVLREYVEKRCSMAQAIGRAVKAGHFAEHVPNAKTMHRLFAYATQMGRDHGGGLPKDELLHGRREGRARLSKEESFAAKDRLAECWKWVDAQ